MAATRGYSDDLAPGPRAGRRRRRIADARFRALDLKVETKPDMTPVTDADTGGRGGIRATLHRARPGDAVLGEEYGDEPGAGRAAG